MRVEVRPHIELRPLLRAWRDGLSDDPARRAMMFDVYWSGLVDQVVAGRRPGPWWCPKSRG